MRIIGDVHQHYPAYYKICGGAEYSLQLGDMGFHYSLKVDADKHKFFGGNHDNYTIYDLSPHQIGDYGEYSHGGINFFFIRGAFSIDKKFRQPDLTWWHEEELSTAQMNKVYDKYVAAKPAIVITHTCPTTVAKRIGKPDVLTSFGFNPDTFTTATQTLLENCFRAHQPTTWIFGHFHRKWNAVIEKTRFLCLPESGYKDI